MCALLATPCPPFLFPRISRALGHAANCEPGSMRWRGVLSYLESPTLVVDTLNRSCYRIQSIVRGVDIVEKPDTTCLSSASSLDLPTYLQTYNLTASSHLLLVTFHDIKTTHMQHVQHARQ
ncbi:hypothetical protein BJX96DRAFT_155549, partial [Aspergillus floccosus]